MPSARAVDQPLLLEELFEKHFDSLLAYARRRTPQLADAEEAVAQTFLIAWRRLADVPTDDEEQRRWLYAVGRRVLANERRGQRRRARLSERLRGTVSLGGASAGVPPPSPLAPVLEALERLAEGDREILRLVAWEGLSHAEAASVMGITPNAATIRLHRARQRLQREIDKPSVELKGTKRVRTWLGWKGSTDRRSQREESQ